MTAYSLYAVNTNFNETMLGISRNAQGVFSAALA